METIIEKSLTPGKSRLRYIPRVIDIKYAYEHTWDSAPVRALTVDIFANEGQSACLIKYLTTIPLSFLQSLTIKLLDRKARIQGVN